MRSGDKTFKVRKAVPDDVDHIAGLEKICFASPWSSEDIRHEIEENEKALYIVAESGGIPVGYAGIWIICDEGHITNVAVHPEYRSMHIGSAVMDMLLNESEKRGALRQTLEVRASNVPALRLYRKFGFREAGIRKGYYEDDHEDAVIMWRGNAII